MIPHYWFNKTKQHTHHETTHALHRPHNLTLFTTSRRVCVMTPECDRIPAYKHASIHTTKQPRKRIQLNIHEWNLLLGFYSPNKQTKNKSVSGVLLLGFYSPNKPRGTAIFFVTHMTPQGGEGWLDWVQSMLFFINPSFGTKNWYQKLESSTKFWSTFF